MDGLPVRGGRQQIEDLLAAARGAFIGESLRETRTGSGAHRARHTTTDMKTAPVGAALQVCREGLLLLCCSFLGGFRNPGPYRFGRAREELCNVVS
ncbi:hypothetical protein LMG27174_01850 [Paraburkholderia rhynchosiae]|uniref:Uncharacterized protein n=1 Tax=Paraburkholderia rhynchosiae TaxID=487049 RepID=A0A6J5ASQ9_9BURK|nr:hypothetical protein LMG27174_01850 [Paraburkholderia rhynchosiae]